MKKQRTQARYSEKLNRLEHNKKVRVVYQSTIHDIFSGPLSIFRNKGQWVYHYQRFSASNFSDPISPNSKLTNEKIGYCQLIDISRPFFQTAFVSEYMAWDADPNVVENDYLGPHHESGLPYSNQSVCPFVCLSVHIYMSYDNSSMPGRILTKLIQQQASSEEEAFRFWNDFDLEWFPRYWTLTLSIHIFYVVR